MMMTGLQSLYLGNCKRMKAARSRLTKKGNKDKRIKWGTKTKSRMISQDKQWNNK